MHARNGTATFVMPHWSKGGTGGARHLAEAVESILNQTDDDWRLVIVDDGSPSRRVRAGLAALEREHPGRIDVILKPKNDGPGACRNIGIRRAMECGSPFVLFIDADDLAGESRLEVTRRIFAEDPGASVVYTTFRVIDEATNLVPEQDLTPSIIEILDSHRHDPPQGPNAWIEIGTSKGYSNLTSATSVRTEVACRFPFPCEDVSEDSHTWMRYSAGAGNFVFTPRAPTLYRIPQHTAGSSSRSRGGGRHEFYLAKARVDSDGFERAVELALHNGKIEAGQVDELMIRFYIKLGETLAKENEFDLAAAQIQSAMTISAKRTRELLICGDLAGRVWTKIDEPAVCPEKV